MIVPSLSALFARARSNLGRDKDPLFGAIFFYQLAELPILLQRDRTKCVSAAGCGLFGNSYNSIS